MPPLETFRRLQCPLDVDSSRPLRANSRHTLTALRMVQIDTKPGTRDPTSLGLARLRHEHAKRHETNYYSGEHREDRDEPNLAQGLRLELLEIGGLPGFIREMGKARVAG